MAVLSAMPLKVHYAFSSFFAWLLRDVMRYRHDVIITNLSRSFPDRKYKEIKEMARDFYKHFGDIIVEAIWFGHSSRERLKKQRLYEFVNPDVVNEAFLNAPSVMILNSHCGNWEAMGGYFNYNYSSDAPFVYDEGDMCVVYKHLSSPLWDEVMRDNRLYPLKGTKFNGYTETMKVMRYAVEHRAEKKVYVFPTDQHPYKDAKKHRVDDFMHQPTMTMTGGAALACKLGMSVIYMSNAVGSRGHYRTTFTEICRDASTMTPEEIMNRYYALLQEEIEAQPWNYLWSHKRWK